MRILTETHPFEWALSSSETRRTQARHVVADPLAWREKYVAGAGIPAVAIRADHIRALASLPDQVLGNCVRHEKLARTIRSARRMVTDRPLEHS